MKEKDLKYEDYSELELMTDTEGEDTKELMKDKTELYNAAIEIMADCKEEYKSPNLIIDRIEEWRTKYPQDVLDSSKIMCSTLDFILPFFRLDVLGFDPLGLTEETFKYYGKTDFEELECWQILKRCRNLCTTEYKNLYAEKTIAEIIANRLKSTIRYLWNPLSRTATERLAQVIKNYSKYVYTQLERQGLEYIKEINNEMSEILNTNIKLLRMTEKRSEYAERRMWRLLKVIVVVMVSYL